MGFKPLVFWQQLKQFCFRGCTIYNVIESFLVGKHTTWMPKTKDLLSLLSLRAYSVTLELLLTGDGSTQTTKFWITKELRVGFFIGKKMPMWVEQPF